MSAVMAPIAPAVHVVVVGVVSQLGKNEVKFGTEYLENSLLNTPTIYILPGSSRYVVYC